MFSSQKTQIPIVILSAAKNLGYSPRAKPFTSFWVTHSDFTNASFVTRPAIDARIMLPVTVKAPAHFYLTRPGDARHACHVPMALAANTAGADMHHVREIDEVRHPVDPYPGDGLFILPVRHEFLNFRSVLGYEQVTGPAIGDCRDAGNRGLGSGPVTEEAWDSVVAGMNFVTEGDRLDRRVVPKIQRQNIHECQDGDENKRRDCQSAKKPGYFHAVLPGRDRCRTRNIRCVLPALLAYSVSEDM
jgi:hypothetical protein